MSQSDYIRYKRITNQLTDAASLDRMPRVINQKEYTSYKSFTLSNIKYKPNDTFHQYVDPSLVNIDGMWKNLDNIVCILTPYRDCNNVIRPYVNLESPSVIQFPSNRASIPPALNFTKWKPFA